MANVIEPVYSDDRRSVHYVNNDTNSKNPLKSIGLDFGPDGKPVLLRFYVRPEHSDKVADIIEAASFAVSMNPENVIVEQKPPNNKHEPIYITVSKKQRSNSSLSSSLDSNIIVAMLERMAAETETLASLGNMVHRQTAEPADVQPMIDAEKDRIANARRPGSGTPGAAAAR